jgi:hypothetical protein
MRLMTVLAGAALMELAGCDVAKTCPDGYISEDVHAGSQGEYVCIPDNQQLANNDSSQSSSSSSSGTDTAPTKSVTVPNPSPSPYLPDADAGAPPPPPACTAIDTSSARDVAIVPRVGTAPPPAGNAPDGAYELAQASVYGSSADAGAAAVTALRARLTISGAVLNLGVNGGAYSLTYMNGTLIEVCATGSDSASLFPGGVGTTSRADLGWRAPVLTLVLHRSDGDLELLFEPK